MFQRYSLKDSHQKRCKHFFILDTIHVHSYDIILPRRTIDMFDHNQLSTGRKSTTLFPDNFEFEGNKAGFSLVQT